MSIPEIKYEHVQYGYRLVKGKDGFKVEPVHNYQEKESKGNSWTDKKQQGVKFDQEKPRTDLLDPVALEGLANVLAFGARKYAAHNWRGGISYSRLLGAAIRHIFAILRGEDIDKESGLPHVDHLGCCWMFLSNMMKTRPDLDDRYKE